MFGDGFKWLTLLYEIVDFLVSAIAAYVQTDAGEQDWADVLAKLAALDLFDVGEPPEGVTPEDADWLEDIRRAVENTSDSAQSASQSARKPMSQRLTGEE